MSKPAATNEESGKSLAGWVAFFGNLMYDAPFDANNRLSPKGRAMIRKNVDISGNGTIESGEFRDALKRAVDTLLAKSSLAPVLANDFILHDTPALRSYKNMLQKDLGMKIDPLTPEDKKAIIDKTKGAGFVFDTKLLDEIAYTPPDWTPPVKKAENQFSLA